MSEQLFMSVADAATAMCVSKITIYRMVKTNQIQHVKMGRRIVIPVAAIKKLACIEDSESN